jgi:outer membrane receptor protein involved in Fe transport
VKLEQNLRRLHDALQNWTLFVSYVHNKSSTEMRDPYTGKKLPMPNTAEQVARVNLNYSKNRFTGRMSYQWRGQSLKASVSESGLSVWNQGTGSLNLNLGWRLNDTFQFGLDGRNLLAEDQLRTTDYDAQLWRFTERYRSISATLRAKW